MFEDFKSCYARLEFFDNLIEQIIRMVDGHTQLEGDEREEARGLLKELKKELTKDCDFMCQPLVKETLSDVDTYFYCPTAEQALARLTMSASSAPGQKWLPYLYDAQAGLRECMGKVENYI